MRQLSFAWLGGVVTEPPALRSNRQCGRSKNRGAGSSLRKIPMYRSEALMGSRAKRS
jgi:hypothetical protein